MKQLSIALNILLLVLVGILFYLHFDHRKKVQKPVAASNTNTAAVHPGSVIGYFEMDSLQANYNYFKDALNQLKEKEKGMNNELSGLERAYQQKVNEWQKRGASMSQAEADAVQRENAQLQQSYQARKQSLEESFARQSMEFKKDIKKKIEVFLLDYNKDKKYSYILSYEPDFIFLRDTTCNITSDLVTGLNAAYKKK
ncbi:MAG TPA: OmpH family outer membrane protein [Chitinophagaceae bacterium]|nr:OmpH family outer membrane protein [Chitinophagaceae bacterium]